MKLFFNLLRFFNLLEVNDFPILSISKVFAWVMLIAVVVILFTMPENIAAVIAVSGGNAIAMLNYAHKRHLAYKENESKK